MNDSTSSLAPVSGVYPSPSSHAAEVVLDVHAADPAPLYPALVARALATDAADGVVLCMRPQPTIGALLERLRGSTSTLAVLSPAAALAAIANGLPARIVGAAASPAGLSHDGRSSPFGGSRDARAVFVAPVARLERDFARVAAALRAYWRGAVVAANDRCILEAALVAEFGFPHGFAHREAERALASWRLDPDPSDAALLLALEQLGLAADAVSCAYPRDFVDPRFIGLSTNPEGRLEIATSRLAEGRAT